MRKEVIRLLQIRRAERLSAVDAANIWTINGQPILINGQYITTEV